MSRFIRLLKSSRDESLNEELQLKCSKCGKRPAIDQDGLCKQCRFSEVLKQMTEKK